MRLLPILLLTGMLPGCATLVEGTSQSMTVATTPAGAACTLDRNGERLGTIAPTPGSLRVDKSKNDVSVTCAKEGYQTATTSHSSKFVGTTFGNILAGGVVGVLVDAASGANFQYPNEVQVELAPVAPAVAGSTVAAVRFAIMSAWNGLLLAEWFGSTYGVGWRSRYWYDANQLDGFLAWVLVFILLLVIADLLILGPIERYATRWRTA